MENRNFLIDAARQGDRSALERLLAVSQPDIRRYAQSQCTGAGDVDDAVQETLWLVYAASVRCGPLHHFRLGCSRLSGANAIACGDG